MARREEIARKRVKTARAVSILGVEARTVRDMAGGETPKVVILRPDGWLDLDQAAAHLRLSLDDFNYFRLLGRIAAPVDNRWLAATLVLRTRAPYKEQISGLYVIQFMEFIKIGYSSNLYQRLGGLQHGLPLRMKIIKVIQGPTRAKELQLHRNFAEYRTQGEWYRHEGRLAAWIEAGCK